MYRTGDIARFLPDENLEFLGRADFQVKLRGFRIEIGEIEVALENQEGVGQAVVIAREFKPERQALGRLYRSEGRIPAKYGNSSKALASTLPEYMVPSSFVFLDALPLTANGKIDRNALPTPLAAEEHSSSTVLERPAERAGEPDRCRFGKTRWDVDRVGVNENFFDLGAHSLMVAEVHAQLQQLLGRELSLVDLFQFPTVLALANHLSGQEKTQPVSSRAERRRAAQQRRAQ